MYDVGNVWRIDTMTRRIVTAFLICSFLLAPITSALAAGNALSIQYEEPQNGKQQRAKDAIKDSGVIEKIAEYINTNLQLPEPMTLRITANGSDEARYDNKTRTIEIPYGLWSECHTCFEKEYSDKDVGNILDELCKAVVAYSIYRELGHAFVDVYDLSARKYADTATDEFAVLMLIDSFHSGRDMALIAGDYLVLRDKQRYKVADKGLISKLVLHNTRVLAAYCMAYGVLPDEELKQEMLELKISEKRLEQCIVDAESKVAEWVEWLKRHGKLHEQQHD
jgi:hypothetical protein